MSKPAPKLTKHAIKGSYEKRIRPPGIEMLFNGTSVSSEKMSTNAGYAGRYRVMPDGVVQETWEILPYQAPLEGADHLLRAKIASRIRAKIKDQKINLAQSLAEYRSTAALFGDFGTRVLRAIRAARRLNVYGVLTALVGTDTTKYPTRWRDVAKTPTRSLAETQLAFSFGVKPLILDLDGAIAAMLAARGVTPIYRRITATVSETLTGKGSRTHQMSNGLARHDYSLTRVTRIRGTCWVEYDGHTVTTMSSRLGFRNVAALAWELTPYSVFIDYFINVGEFLENFGALKGVKRHAVHYSSVVTDTSENAFTPDFLYGVGGETTFSRTTSGRIANQQLGIVTLGFKTPTNFSQILNLLAFARLKLPKAVKP